MSFKGRQQANRELIAILTKYAEAWPNQRFGQLLSNLGINQRSIHESLVCIEDNIHEESTDTLKRVAEMAYKLNSS